MSAQLSEPTFVDENGSWYDRKTAAQFFGVHPSTIRNWADNGDLATMQEPGGRRVLVLIPEAEQTANGQASDGMEVANDSTLMPVAQEEIRRLLEKALGADEWANRAGVSEEKANHLKQRVRALRDELAVLKQERDEAVTRASEYQDRIGDLRVELERVAAGKQRAEDDYQRLLTSLSPRQRKRLGVQTP